MTTPDEVLANPCPHLEADCVLTKIIVIYEFVQPNEDDEIERGPWLSFTRDNDAGLWNHLGMLESVANDMRAMLRMRTVDE